MRKPEIQDAYRDGTELLFSRYAKWLDGYGLMKVTLVSIHHGHWAYDSETRTFEARTSPSKYGSHKNRTQTGYLVQDKNGAKYVVTATQMRGTWADCQKAITGNNLRMKQAEEIRAQEIEAFQDVRDDIHAFGLHIRGWSTTRGEVTVSGAELLALLRELQKGPGRSL